MADVWVTGYLTSRFLSSQQPCMEFCVIRMTQSLESFAIVSHRTQDSGCVLVCEFNAPPLFICPCARSFFCSKEWGGPRVPPISFQGEDEEAEKQKGEKTERRETKEKKQKKEGEERRLDKKRRRRSRRREER